MKRLFGNSDFQVINSFMPIIWIYNLMVILSYYQQKKEHLLNTYYELGTVLNTFLNCQIKCKFMAIKMLTSAWHGMA